MTPQDKLAMTEALSGEQDSFAIQSYLDLAEAKIKDRANPYDQDAPMPERYAMLQCELAAALLTRRGADGQESHSENGISRVYVDEEKYLERVTPMIGVPL